MIAFAPPASLSFRLSSSRVNPLVNHRSLRRPVFPRPVHRPSPMTMSTPAAPARRILVAIGNGSEEIETACAVDTFVRAGADVVLASVEDSLIVRMSRGMKYVADISIAEVDGSFDAVALPGGMPGAERLRDSAPLIKILKKTRDNGDIVAAVCASPAVVFATHGIIDGKKATCYPHPAFRGEVVKLSEGDVVVDGNVITATGPGTSLKWAIEIVGALYDQETAKTIADQMLVTL